MIKLVMIEGVATLKIDTAAVCVADTFIPPARFPQLVHIWHRQLQKKKKTFIVFLL